MPLVSLKFSSWLRYESFFRLLLLLLLLPRFLLLNSLFNQFSGQRSNCRGCVVNKSYNFVFDRIRLTQDNGISFNIDLAFFFAPASTKAMATSKLDFTAATCSGVQPDNTSASSTSPPSLINSRIKSPSLLVSVAAQCMALHPWTSVASGSAPSLLSSRLASDIDPFLAAMRSKASQPRRRPLLLFLPVSVRLLRWVDVLVLRPLLRRSSSTDCNSDDLGRVGREGSSSCS